MLRQKGFTPLFLLPIVFVGLLVVYLIYAYTGSIIHISSSPLSTNTTPSPSPSNFRETANWKTYTNDRYGFTIQSPQSFTTTSTGPNSAEQQLNQGQTISGTVQPSLDTIVFSDQGSKQFEIAVFPVTDIIIEPTSYEKSLYLYGPCDLRFLTSKPSPVEIANFFELLAVKVNVAETNKYLSCYYFKNKAGNLLVLSTSESGSKSQSDMLDLLVSKIINTFKFIEQKQTSKLVPADSQTPAAGTCVGPSLDQLVTVTIGLDNVPQPRCTKVTANQKLKIVNNKDQNIQQSIGQYVINVAPGQSQTIDATFGSYLAPGVHDIVSEIWLQN